MSGREFGIIAFRLLACWLFLHAIYYGVGTVLVGVFTLSSHVIDDLSRFLVPLGVLLSCVVYGGVARWYWRAAERLAAPPADSLHESTMPISSSADAKLAPLLIVALAAWGSMRLAPTLQKLYAYLVYTGTDFGIPLSETLSNPAVHRRLAFEIPDFLVALVATVAARPLIGLLLNAKRKFARKRLSAMPELGEP